MIRNFFIRIKVFFIFLNWVLDEPTYISEHWEDMGFRYLMETDSELIKIQKEIEEEYGKRK